MSPLSQSGLIVVTWVFTGSGIALTAGRYAIRLKTVKGLKADDYVHGLALLALISFVSTYTFMFPLNHAVEIWVAGLGKQPSKSDLKRYFHLEIAVSTQFWVVIYLAKLAFLLFYRTLFGVSQTFMRAWWIVSIFTLLTFVTNFLISFWACGAPRHLFVLERCLSQRALDINAKIVSTWCGLNVASDLSIMALPVWMLRRLQVPTGRKIGLAILFLLAITGVVFDITRTVYTVDGGTEALDTEIILDILEPTIAVIVSALPTYKALLGNPKKKKRTPSYESLRGNGGTVGANTRTRGIDTITNIEHGSKNASIHDTTRAREGLDATSVF